MKSEWIIIVQSDYTKTCILNLGFSAFIRESIFNDDGDYVSVSICETDAQGASMLIKQIKAREKNEKIQSSNRN